MEWLLGSGAVAGVVAMATAVFVVFSMARRNREDLLKHLETLHALDEMRMQRERAERAVEERDASIQDLQGNVANERSARELAEKHLDGLLAELARSGDPSGAGERMRRSLRLLAELSGVPGAAAGQDRGEAGAVHGTPAAGPGGAGSVVNIPRPERP